MPDEEKRQDQYPAGEPPENLAQTKMAVPPTPEPTAVRVVDPVTFALKQSTAPLTEHRALWVAIQNRAAAMSFPRYQAFIDQVLCRGERPRNPETFETCADDARGFERIKNSRLVVPMPLHGVDAYLLLKAATEFFLLRECGVHINEIAGATTVPGLDKTHLDEPLDFKGMRELLQKFFAGRPYLPYFEQILSSLGNQLTNQLTDSPYCFGLVKTRLECPCMIELIWSYWHEEGMLVQAITSVAFRFQNRRVADKDPLAMMEIGFLRPLNNLLWGYVQDEHNRLSIARRAYEYDHHYGLTLFGKAVPQLRTADGRSKFLAAFHHLLHRASEFYKQVANLMVVPDTFPLLQALAETHLLLSEGMHNQYGDLPWTARVEMLIQQWLLSTPEMREFLRSREMVPYPEGWMGQVDTMKTLQGWTDTNVRHFRDLAVFGEQILLSVRFGNWSQIPNPNEARSWAEFWRPQIQGYLSSYRAVTGVDLTNPATVDATLPSVHLRNRSRLVAAS